MYTEKELKVKSDNYSKLLERILDGTIDIPDEAVIMEPEVMAQIITKKRMELLRLIESRNLDSVQQLADLTGRKKQAVDRDLKLLESYDLISMKKHGRKVRPRIKTTLLVLGVGLHDPIRKNAHALDYPEFKSYGVVADKEKK